MGLRTALLFDIDNTLTPPRRQLTQKMVDILKRVNVPFHVAAGSHMAILEDQFFRPLYSLGYRGQFDAFLSNGSIHYHCDYSERMSTEVVSAFDIRDYLGEADYASVIQILEGTLESPEFQLPSHLEILGDRIVYRGSMINLCPIGRAEEVSEEYHRNRGNFIQFDKTNSYRIQVLNHLRRELSPYMERRHLIITLGGQTSFDLGIEDQDKTVAVRALLKSGTERVVFLGDALFEGGNDAALREFVENWSSELSCPLECFQVNDWKETIDRLYELGFIDE